MKRFSAFVLALLLTVATSTFAKPDHSKLRDYVQFVHVEVDLVAPPALINFQPDAKPKASFYGSAVVIAPGYAVSAWHVFAAAEEIPEGVRTKIAQLMSRDGKTNRVPLTVVAKDIEHDLVLVKGEFTCPCAPLAVREAELDELVYAVGFPQFARHGVQLLTKGTYQGLSVLNTYLVTTHMAPGGSGGGGFQKEDGELRLIGIVDAIGAANLGPPQFGIQQEVHWTTFLTPVKYVHALIKGTPAENLVR